MISPRRYRQQRGAVHLTILAIILCGLVFVVLRRHDIEAALMRTSQKVAVGMQRVGTRIVEKGSGMVTQVLRGNFRLHDPNDVIVTPGLFDNFWGDADIDTALPPLVFLPLTANPPTTSDAAITYYECASHSPRVECKPVALPAKTQ